MSYKWVHGARIKADADAIGMELERLSNQGPLTPDTVVEAARHPASVLHEAVFRYAPEEAAEQWYLQEARYLLRSIKVVIQRDERQHEVRAFVNLSVSVEEEERQESVYLNVVQVMADPGLRQQLLVKALREIEWWERRYREYEELGPIVHTIEETRERVLAIA